MKNVISHMTFGMHEEKLESHTEVFTQGEQCEFIIFIVEGKVDIKMEDKNGIPVKVDTLEKGSIIGSDSILFKKEILFTAQAEGNIRIFKLQKSYLMTIGENFFGLGEILTAAKENFDYDETNVKADDYILGDSGKLTEEEKF
jgi:CRP-like cAMP-binding protein